MGLRVKPSSAKAKGRKLQQHVATLVRLMLGLPDADVKSAVMGESGMDIKLSTEGRRLFPFAVECKCQESLNIWAAFQQAQDNAEKGLAPLLVFKRNHSDVLCALQFSDLLEMLAHAHNQGVTYTPRSPLG